MPALYGKRCVLTDIQTDNNRDFLFENLEMNVFYIFFTFHSAQNQEANEIKSVATDFVYNKWMIKKRN